MQVEDQLNLIAHHPASAHGDALGFIDYANTVRDILVQLAPENTGLTIGVFGDWGSGKSSILRMVGDLLRDTAPRSKTESQTDLNSGFRPLVVEFSAWQYQQDQVWVALLRKIALTINTELGFFQLTSARLGQWKRRIRWKSSLIETTWKLLRLLVVSLVIIGVLLVGILLVQKALSQQSLVQQFFAQAASRLNQIPSPTLTAPQPLPQTVALDNALDWLELLLGLLTIAAGIWAGFSTLVRGAYRFVAGVTNWQPRLPPRLLRPNLDKDMPFAAEQFREELLDLVAVVGKRRPFVVLIDDLDRAQVDQIVPVLEAMKHFGVEPEQSGRATRNKRHASIAFVLAADPGLIKKAIAGYYKDYQSTLKGPQDIDYFAREYLEKIVQLPFELPPLSNVRLGLLLGGDPITFPEPKGNVMSLKSALEEARSVFAQGPKENPRQVIQAYNTFQTIWLLVRRRKLELIDPQLLGTLVLVRYVWPNSFQWFYRYPELFFDLHALVSKTPNARCQETEIEEILSLGCPGGSTVMIEVIRQQQPDLLHMLRVLSLPDGLEVPRFLAHFALIEDQPTPKSYESGAALMSGDPSLVKFIARTNRQEVLRERLDWLIEFLQVDSDAKDEDAREQSEKTVKALFALGRILDDSATEAIEKVIETPSVYPKAVVQRAIYALAHLAEGSVNKHSARLALTGVLGNDQFPASAPLQLRVLRLLNATVRSEPNRIEDEVRCHVVRLALGAEMKIVRNKALELAIQGRWLREAFSELINEEGQTANSFDGFLQIVEACQPPSLPNDIGDFLIKLAADTGSQYHDRAFRVLSRGSDPSVVIEYMARLVEDANLQEAPELVLQAIDIAGTRQTEVVWQESTWTRLKERLSKAPWDLWVAYVRALGLTKRDEAAASLKDILTQPDSDNRVRKVTLQSLQNLADVTVNAEVRTDLQMIIDAHEDS